MKRLNFDTFDKNHGVTAYERHYTSSLLSTCQRRNSSPAISTSWPQLWSPGQASVYNWRNNPSELCDFHSQSQGRSWYFRTALETLSTQIAGEWSASCAKENIGPFGVRIWQWIYVEFIWHPGILHHDHTQPYRDDKCTKQLYSVWILPVNYKQMINRHAGRIDLSTHVLLRFVVDS